MRGTRDYMARFARSLCQNFPVLQEKGPPKWCETEMSLPSLGRGWFYYPPTAKELKACVVAKTNVKAQAAPSQCKMQERILGLCS
ncbi:MAG: hypothetical protein E6H66_08560 [Betaproteobacteria bacterium]|nr:MAG: hypothetical protein E6H66_08560 [Betaproteobacteria bacterium]